jgi:hypothetical protein
LDPYVKGALSYQWGSLDPAWDSHDWTPELVPLLRDYIISQQGGEPPPPPPPEEDWKALYEAERAKVEAVRRIVC